jgi:prepilin-type N-terminal cleavage/methylation domain-containing protein
VSHVNVEPWCTSNGVKNAMYTIASAKLRAADRLAEGRPYRRSAFTLIEVLVVVAIIALLLAILLPSLSRARDISKSTMCMSHLKEFGLATSMYMMDHKETLPGPLHPGMFTKVYGLSAFARQQHLPRMLKKYFSDKSQKDSKAKSVVDDLATCPSFPVPDERFDQIAGAPYPFHYVVNTWTYTEPKQYYFGFIWLQFNSYDDWINYISSKGGVAVFGPKTVAQVRKPQAEWAIADAFRKPRAGEVDFDLNLLKWGGHGSWPREDVSNSNSGNALTNSPFHLGNGHKAEGGSYVYNGRVNTLYFDMHAESQRGFRGTVNPSPQN